MKLVCVRFLISLIIRFALFSISVVNPGISSSSLVLRLLNVLTVRRCIVLRTFRSFIEDGEAVDEDGESVEDGKEEQPGLQGVGLKTMPKIHSIS